MPEIMTPSKKRKLNAETPADKQLVALAAASTDTRTDISRVATGVGSINRQIARLTTEVADLKRYRELPPVYSTSIR